MAFFTTKNRVSKKEGTAQTFVQNILLKKSLDSETSLSHVEDQATIQTFAASSTIINVSQVATAQQENLDSVKAQVAVVAAENDNNSSVVVGTKNNQTSQQVNDISAFVKN